MSVIKGEQPRKGGRLSAEDAAQLFDASRQVVLPSPGAGYDVTSAAAGYQQAPYPQLTDQGYVASSFLAKVVDMGPSDEADYEDSRYWVREIVETTAGDAELDDRSEFKLRQESLDDFPESFQQPAWWMTATNLAEYDFEDEEADGHGLDTNGTTIVRVHLIPTDAGKQPRWYFSQGTGGGTKLVVIREAMIDEDHDRNFVIVAEVTWETSGYVIDDTTYEVFTWPPLTASDYRYLTWIGDTAQEATIILPAVLSGGRWYVQQSPTFDLQLANPDYQVSDCRGWVRAPTDL